MEDSRLLKLGHEGVEYGVMTVLNDGSALVLVHPGHLTDDIREILTKQGFVEDAELERVFQLQLTEKDFEGDNNG